MRGLREKSKRMKVFRFLKQNDIKIACLQETHSSKNSHKIWKNESKGTIIYSDGEILFSYKIEPNTIKIEKDKDGRLVIVDFVYNNMSFRLINVYAPNHDDPQFFVDILEKANDTQTDHSIIMGDFNVCLTKKDKKGGRFCETKTSTLINSFLEESDFIDIWRTLHEDQFQYTWKRNRPLIMHRLDYCITTLATAKAVSACEIIPNSFSDHAAVQVEFSFETNIRGPGFWKLNTRHLQDPEFVNNINQLLEVAKERYTLQNPLNRWESIKKEIQKTAMEYAVEKAKKKKIDLTIWSKKLKAAQKKLAMINLSSMDAVRQIKKLIR